MKEETTSEVRALANALYLRLPWWKRASYRKWKKRNGWDASGIYKRCLLEARLIFSEELYSEDL